jgi:hypothetical protein
VYIFQKKELGTQLCLCAMPQILCGSRNTAFSDYAHFRKFSRIQKQGLLCLCAIPQILIDPATWSSLFMRNAAHSYGSRNMVFSDYAQCRKFFSDPETWSSLIMRNAANSHGSRNMVVSVYAQCRKFLRIQKHGLEVVFIERNQRHDADANTHPQHLKHDTCSVLRTVLRIRDVYPGSPIRVFFYPGSWVQGGKEKNKLSYFLNFLLPQIIQN